jgi:hypothetical protein
VSLEQMGLVQLTTLAQHRLEDLGLFAVLFDQVADVDDALVAGAGTLFGGWVCGLR